MDFGREIALWSNRLSALASGASAVVDDLRTGQPTPSSVLVALLLLAIGVLLIQQAATQAAHTAVAMARVFALSVVFATIMSSPNGAEGINTGYTAVASVVSRLLGEGGGAACARRHLLTWARSARARVWGARRKRTCRRGSAT
jgi:hypothetical protein